MQDLTRLPVRLIQTLNLAMANYNIKLDHLLLSSSYHREEPLLLREIVRERLSYGGTHDMVS